MTEEQLHATSSPSSSGNPKVHSGQAAASLVRFFATGG
jgi:hypothetical protein